MVGRIEAIVQFFDTGSVRGRTQTERSDAWTAELAGQLRWATMSTQSVIGQTGVIPHAEEIPGSELQGQVTMVRAAKEVVRHPNPQAVATLVSAQTALDTFRTQA